MKPIWYSACEKFSPAVSDGWEKYVTWARLPQLTEVVSLDNNLCRSVIRELTPEDWQHNVLADSKTDLFRDLDYLLSRVKDNAPFNLLAVIEEPDLEDVQAFHDARFEWIGFDLVEAPGTGISALVDCGGFDEAFLPSDLNQYGLISDYAVARNVQKLLVEKYPDEHHADCSLWAIWRMTA